MSLTSSPQLGRRGSQVPRVANYPRYAFSAADEVIDLYESVAAPLDPWQRFVLTHGLGMLSAEQWAAFKVACWVARQNGKGTIIEALEIAWLFLPGFQVKLITHSAHLYDTAKEAFRRIKEILDGSDWLRPMVKAVREANGEIGVEMRTGQRLKFMARTRTGGRGFSAPRVILDEAQELQPLMMAAALPTMSAQPNPQVWFFGTPPDDPAAWVYGLKADGEAGAPRVAWFDWGADLDLEDPVDRARVQNRDLWYACNPALGTRITEQFVEDEAQPSGLGENFAHERLGVWRPRAINGDGIISEQLWRELADPQGARPADIAFAIDVNPARTHTAIVAVGPRPDGLMAVSVMDYLPGTSWVPARAAELKARWNPVAIGLDVKGPGGSLLLDLAEVGITLPEDPTKRRRGQLATPNAGEAAAAYGLFVDRARQKGLRHFDEAPLNVALAGAKTRPLSGGSAWDRKGKVDICPLVAATNGHWAYVTFVDAVNADYDLLSSFY